MIADIHVKHEEFLPSDFVAKTTPHLLVDRLKTLLVIISMLIEKLTGEICLCVHTVPVFVHFHENAMNLLSIIYAVTYAVDICGKLV